MKLGLDLDGTISDTRMFVDLARAVHAAGGEVHVVTAVVKNKVTDADYESAKRRLGIYGFAGHYDKLFVVCKPIAKSKAKYCAAHGIDLFIDNRKKNAKRVEQAGIPSCLYLGH